MSLTIRQITKIKELLNEILQEFHSTLTTINRLASEKKCKQIGIDFNYSRQEEIDDCERDKQAIATYYDKKIKTLFPKFLTFYEAKTQNLRQLIPEDLTDDNYTLLRQLVPELSFTEFSLLLPSLAPDEQKHALICYKEQETASKKATPSKQAIYLPDLVAVVNAAEAILQSHKNKIQLQKDNYIQWKSLCQDKILFFLDPTQQDFLENISTYPDFFQKIITQAILEQRLVSAIKDLSSFTIFSGKIATYLSSNCKENVLNKLIENSTLLTILTANPLQSFTTEIGVMLDKKQKKSLIDQWIVSGDLITKIKQESSPWSFFDSNLAQHLTPEQKQQIQENIKKHLLTELPNGFIDIYFLESHFCKLDRPEQKQILHTIGNSSNPAVIEYFLNWTIDELHSIQIASNTNFEKKANINNSIRALQEIGKGKALREIASIQHTLSELLNTLYLIDEKQVAMTRSDVANTSLAAQKISQLLKLFEPTDPQEQEKNQRLYEQLKTVIGTIKVKQWQTSGILGFF